MYRQSLESLRRRRHTAAAGPSSSDSRAAAEPLPILEGLIATSEIRIRPHDRRPSDTFLIESADGLLLLIAERERRLGERFGAIAVALGVLIAAGLPVIMLASVQTKPMLFSVVLFLGLLISGLIALVFLLGLYPKRCVRIFLPDTADRPRSGQEWLLALPDSGTPILLGSCTIADSDLNLVGWISRSFVRDGLFRARWHCYTGEGMLQAVVTEDAAFKTLLRYLFQIAGVGFIPPNYRFHCPETGLPLAQLVRTDASSTFRTLDFRDDEDGDLDRRLAIVMAILIEATSD